MRQVKLFSMLLSLMLFVVFTLGIPGSALAGGTFPPPPPSLHPNIPQCIDMPGAQVPGTKPGTACRVPVVAPSGGLYKLELWSLGQHESVY
jgi:hypothetical protein